ncbi:nucleolar protein 16 [Solanum pennellii]|uniref:Nucleolar protein 16 n=1 Tax=Solanum pennellii TaxID=28526 RepID=A0ABM1HIZ7_SOLPN|nr:nucleolar protein 16 [Solanum pennellii]
MGGSRRKYKRSRAKVRVGLPKKNPNVFKPAFSLPPKLRSLVNSHWDDKGSVIDNYKSFGVVSNPNLLGVRCRTSHMIETDSLQVPPPKKLPPTSEDDDDDADAFEDLDDSGSEVEEDDLKSALGKKRRDGKSAPLQPLTTIQRVYISRLVEEYGDDYQSMFMDIKLNKMQHSVATLEKLCKRYDMYKDKNPLLVGT